MLRVINSTIQGLDIDADLEDAFTAAVNAAQTARDTVRETFQNDEIGQKSSHIALVPYTDPTGAHRWAVLEENPADIDWQDTDDLDEAIAAYEYAVRATTKGFVPNHDEEGEERPVWDESDVDGVPARTVNDGDSNNHSALLIDAKWAHEEFTAAEKGYQQATQRRQVAFAKMIDAWGRGGQSALASRVDLKDPTVKVIADKGRQILAERAAAALPQVTVQDLRELLDSPAEQPVLYLDNENGLSVRVWAQALAPSGHVIVDQDSLRDMIGDDMDDESLAAALEDLDLQDTVADIAATIRGDQ